MPFEDAVKVATEFFGAPRSKGTSHHIFRTPWPGDPHVNLQRGKEREKSEKMNYEPKHYTYRVVWSEEDEEYVGLCAEFPLMSWFEEEPHAAYDGIVNLVAEVLSDMEGTGETPPEPLTMRKYSGDLRLRMPPELHRRLAMDAAEGRTSVNKLILERIAWGDRPTPTAERKLPRKTTKVNKRKLTA